MAMKHLESRSGNSASVKHDTKLVITSSGWLFMSAMEEKIKCR
jgi:hypothetical protein